MVAVSSKNGVHYMQLSEKSDLMRLRHRYLMETAVMNVRFTLSKESKNFDVKMHVFILCYKSHN